MQNHEVVPITPTKEYRPNFQCIALMFVGSLAAMTALYAGMNWALSLQHSIMRVIGFSLFLSLSTTVSYARNARLIVGLEGIEYRETDRTVARWPDAMMTGPNPFKRYWKTPDGIILRQSQFQPWGFLAILPPRTLPIGFIPLARFDRNWRNGPLGDDLRQYAPWLFADEMIEASSLVGNASR